MAVTVTNQKTTFDADTNPDIPVAAELTGGVEYQHIKLIDATAASTSPTGVAANPLRTLENAPTGVGSGQKTVASAGTAEALAGSTAVLSVAIKALAGNTGYIYVGASSVDSTNGFVLEASETVSLDIANLATVYIDSSVNGEGVSFIYGTA